MGDLGLRPGRTIAIAAAAIVGIQILVGTAIVLGFSNDLEKAGQFGDLFGAVNALFSGLAFAGLIYTALLQRAELSLQRRELELTRTELARTARAQEQSEVALKAQAEAANQSAKLSAINFLLAHYQLQRQKMSGAFTAGSEQDIRRRKLTDREQILSSMLDRLFDEVTKQQGNQQ